LAALLGSGSVSRKVWGCYLFTHCMFDMGRCVLDCCASPHMFLQEVLD
jgi:hypothetical protein